MQNSNSNNNFISFNQHRVPIIEGHDGGSYFWIMPIRQLSSRDKGDSGVEECSDEEISMEEDDVFEFLQYFLIKYFDENFPYICRDEFCSSGIDWNLEHNIYSYETMRNMISEIRQVMEMFQNDYNNPALNDIKKGFHAYVYTFGYKDSGHRTDENNEDEFIRNNIYIAIDFYDRFCKRMESMMKNAPQYDLISFMGP